MAAVVAIKREKSAALAALTSAALGLPGLAAQAATPLPLAEGNVQYGHYEESGNRMKVDVYHSDFTVPVDDHLEFSFSIDRDTYSGASPAYSLPAAMTNQLQYKQKSDGTAASTPTRADVVSAASGGVTAQGLTVLGGLNTYKNFVDARTSAEAAFRASNPEPPSPAPTMTVVTTPAGTPAAVDTSPTTVTTTNVTTTTVPTIAGDINIQFSGMRFSSYAGAANVAPEANGNCPGTGSAGCYYENGMAFGIVSDATNPIAHLHRTGSAASAQLTYHADSSGIYVRAQNNVAFALNSLLFDASATTNTGANDYWNILGFNTAANPNLGTNQNPSTKVASQTVPANFNGSLQLNPGFQNVNAFWIYYNGYPQTPSDGKEFSVNVDNISLSAVKPTTTVTQTTNTVQSTSTQTAAAQPQTTVVVTQPTGRTPEQQAWDKALEKQVAIAQYQAVLNSLVPTNTRIVQRFQTQPLETRTMPVFGAKYYWNDTLLALSAGYSDEPDYKSNFGSLNLTQDFNDKHTTVTVGYNIASNNIFRNGDNSHTSHHATDPTHNPTSYPELNGTSTFQGASFSIAQVLSKNTLLQLTGNYTNQHGYLSNPYKMVYVRGEITAEEYYNLWQAPPGGVDWNSVTKLQVVGIDLFRENRPKDRNQGSVSLGLSQHIPELDASLNLNYRFFADDWGINSHTFEFKWYQSLPYGIMITPNIRYYSQSHADFFAPYFLSPRADGFYSSDYRLSGYGALSGGVTFSKKFGKGINLQAGIEYYTHAGGLKLGGGGEDAYADFSYYLAHASLNFNLSAPNFSSAHHHHHEASQPPAGVMFAHMMDQADSVMLGYRYMYSNQSGDMLHGTNAVSNQTLVNRACGSLPCASRPDNMTMHMHMFDLMYAPTDWLNLMLMPQLVDMSMDTSALTTAVTADAHEGGHHTNGLGDTILMGMVKLYGEGGHHIHAGIGLSAPTGDVNLTMDGRYSDTSLLQDYGMQTGSGTWDFKPSLSYTGHWDDWSWGAQLSGILRLENRSKAGYALGDVFQSTAWGSYSLFNWLSASVRGSYTVQGSIRGEYNSAHSVSNSVDYPSNYGGRFWDLGMGVNVSVPEGAFTGHTLSVEWVQPLSNDVNGYQLERTGTLAANWNYMF